MSASDAQQTTPLTSAVVIPTYNRSDRLRGCLEHLQHLTVLPDRIVVVDSSPDARTEQLVREFPGVVYARNPMGRGRTPESRQIGYSLTAEDVVVFVDDDTQAHPEWLAQLLARYADPTVGGVGGSALNGIAGERDEGLDSIGLLLPDGRLTGNFAADPGHDVDVDHLLGANMSFRRSAIEAVGGIYGDYPGTCLREESDLALRVKAAGHRLLYTPDAVVDHLPGKYAKGKRFDRRYSFYAHRNTIVLLSRIYGPGSSILRHYVAASIREVLGELRRSVSDLPRVGSVGPSRAARTFGGGTTRAVSILAGLVAGVPASSATLRSDAHRRRALNITDGFATSDTLAGSTRA